MGFLTVANEAMCRPIRWSRQHQWLPRGLCDGTRVEGGGGGRLVGGHVYVQQPPRPRPGSQGRRSQGQCLPYLRCTCLSLPLHLQGAHADARLRRERACAGMLRRRWRPACMRHCPLLGHEDHLCAPVNAHCWVLANPDLCTSLGMQIMLQPCPHALGCAADNTCTDAGTLAYSAVEPGVPALICSRPPPSSRRYAGVLSAVGIHLADIVSEEQEPAAAALTADTLPGLEARLQVLGSCWAGGVCCLDARLQVLGSCRAVQGCAGLPAVVCGQGPRGLPLQPHACCHRRRRSWRRTLWPAWKPRALLGTRCRRSTSSTSGDQAPAALAQAAAPAAPAAAACHH